MEEREKHRNKSDKERLVFKWCKCKHICMYALVINNNCLHVHWFLFLYLLCWWSDGSAASLDILLYPILQSNGEIHVKHITWQSCDRKTIFSLWKLSFLCLINANFVLLCMYMCTCVHVFYFYNTLCSVHVHVLSVTCPLMHPPAMRLGLLGLNLKHKISSGASKNNWKKKTIKNNANN